MLLEYRRAQPFEYWTNGHHLVFSCTGVWYFTLSLFWIKRQSHWNYNIKYWRSGWHKWSHFTYSHISMVKYASTAMIFTLICQDKFLSISFDRFQITYPLLNLFWERRIVENTTERMSVQFVGQNYTSNESHTLTGKINITVTLIYAHTCLTWDTT